MAGVLRHWMDGTELGVLDGGWGSADEEDPGRVTVVDGIVATDLDLDEHGLPAAPLDVTVRDFPSRRALTR
ncbi:hypothetical protein ACFQ08_03580 [Streptosporangium algeriense]|uniref:Uncharacterized protein n=1 Tax=Streptosporangium algeriense TaxID=1682748 RepID=A0ABW3DLM4_9ACTN